MLVTLYQSSSQSHKKFSSFIANSEFLFPAIILGMPFLTMILDAKNI